MQALPVTFQDIQKSTRRDPILGKVYRFLLNGWPSHVPAGLKVFKRKETEPSTENGCLMRGIRVVVPKALHSQVLTSLHTNHQGICRMKAIAQSYFWWGGLDKDVEKLGKSC